MTNETAIKREVREFYDQVGWQAVGEGVYQNARYEDLRSVSRDYIHRCHMRVARHVHPTGRFFLDAGSGPIQYPEYLLYSQGYEHRICADLSIVALQEARARLGDHGLFVVADVAHLPFREAAFAGATCLHTIHHLPASEHKTAFEELHRTLSPGSSAVVVQGWETSTFTRITDPLIRSVNRLRHRQSRHRPQPKREAPGDQATGKARTPKGTHVRKHNAAWLKSEVSARIPLDILVWRSLNVRFMRTFIHEKLWGRHVLRLIYWLEEHFPHFFGENGAYPLIVIRKPERL